MAGAGGVDSSILTALLTCSSFASFSALRTAFSLNTVSEDACDLGICMPSYSCCRLCTLFGELSVNFCTCKLIFLEIASVMNEAIDSLNVVGSKGL